MARSEAGPDDAVAARPARDGEIPGIDLMADDAAVARGIAAACDARGFFTVTGHGVPPAIVARAFAEARGFFALPAAEKARAAASADWYRGWVPAPAVIGLSRDSRLFDQYRMQLEVPGEAPNRWPDARPRFAPAMRAYLAAMDALSARLLRGFALALGVAADRFAPWFGRATTQLSLFHYPPMPDGAGADVSSMVPHTDEGPITILAQRGAGGLEVSDAAGGWIAVPVIADAFTINVGDMMTWWSNGRFAARRHRVRNISGGERLSIACFVNPDRAVSVAPLPELGPPRFAAANVGDHLTRFHSALEGRAIR